MGGQENLQTLERLRALLRAGDFENVDQALYDVSTDDFEQYWPQSGELIRGRENARAINRSYKDNTGTAPKMTDRRVSGSDDLWTIEGTIDYGDGTPVSYVGIWEFRNGKIARMTEYFASPFPAPEWRAKWVERVDMAGATAR